MKYLITFLLVVTASLMIWKFFSSPEPVINDINTEFPDPGLITGDNRSELGKQLLEAPDISQWNETEYLVAEKDNLDWPLYQIFYNEAYDTLNVSLQNEALSIARSEAEKYLINDLGLSPDLICSSDARVTVPGWVSENYSGRDLGFSFCPGSVVLE